MTKVATRAPRLGDLVQDEYGRHVGFCRKTITVNEAAETEYKIGRVLGRSLTGGSATATADSGNTGDGTMGAVTVDGNAIIGNYRVVVQEAALDGGEFRVESPLGDVVGVGNVGEEFTGGGISFTLSDGAADFAEGDFFIVEVTGTEKYHTIGAEDVDGSQDFAGIYIGSPDGDNKQTIAAATDTKVVVLWRGPATIGEDLLTYGATVDTDAEKDTVKKQIVNAGFKIQEQPNQFA